MMNGKSLLKCVNRLSRPHRRYFSRSQMTSHAMGSDVGSTPELVEQYTKAVVSATKILFIAKMTPNVTNRFFRLVLRSKAELQVYRQSTP